MIHSKLSINSYDVTADSGLTFDEQRVYATRSQNITFRGSLERLFATFHFGFPVVSPEAGQGRMYCAGPRSISQVPGTGTDPHWDATIEWTGLHSYVHGLVNYIWRLTPLWSEQETKLPQSYDGTTSGTYTFIPGAGALPTGVAADHACVIHDHIPGYQVEGVMVSGVAPYPSHPSILALLNSLGYPNTADMIDYGTNTGAGYHYSKRMPKGSSTSGPTIGVWFPGSISAPRVIEPMGASSSSRIYQVSFPVRWLPRKSTV